MPKTGRPLSDTPKTERLVFRVTQDEKDEIMKFMRDNYVGLLYLVKRGMKAVKEDK